MATKTQQTEIFFIDTDESLVNIGCPTTASFSGSEADEIETTCLSDTSRTYVGGLNNRGTFDFTINFDADETSHARLQALQESGDTLWWAVCLSEATTDPTVDSGGTFDLPTDRSTRRFQGFIKSYGEDITGNSVVTATISVTISGAVEYNSAV